MSLVNKGPSTHALTELQSILKKPYQDVCNVCKGAGKITEQSSCPKCKGSGQRLLKLL
jgi:DnaJ-class molecular chaperone